MGDIDDIDSDFIELLREEAQLVGTDESWLVTMVIRTDDGNMYQIPMIPCTDERTAAILAVHMARLHAAYPSRQMEKYRQHHPRLLPEEFSVECFRFIAVCVTLNPRRRGR